MDTHLILIDNVVLHRVVMIHINATFISTWDSFIPTWAVCVSHPVSGHT